MEIDYNSIIAAAHGGLWNLMFGATGVCVLALVISRVELIFQNASLKENSIVYRGPRIARGLTLMAIGLVGFGAALAAVAMSAGGDGIADSFGKAMASENTTQQLLTAATAATAILFDLGVFVFLMSEQRLGR